MNILRRYYAIIGLFLLIGVVPSVLLAQVAPHLVKAAVINMLIKKIDWPGNKAKGSQSTLNICIVGDDPMLSAKDFFKKASTPQLNYNVIEESSAAAPLDKCHVVFAGDSQSDKIDQLLAAVKGKGVLTISDVKDFAEKGGIIEFTVVDDKMKFIINKKAASDAGIKVPADILPIALKVIS
ncbi:MAG: YfiR family protein [Rickettsiales bacterium]|nr:YfiR family protein [Rickettsiales bacterium]